MSDKRNYGIDLLRMFSMFLIAVLHINRQGGAMMRIAGAPETYYVTWFLETAAYCSMNCYGLISGYAGVDSRPRFSRFMELWLQVFFYSAGITFLTGLVRPDWVTFEGMVRSLMPVTFNLYWYFTAYTGVAFLQPYLNRMILSLTDREKQRLLLVILLLFCCFTAVPRVLGMDIMILSGGNSFVWLMLLYLAGACLKKLSFRKRPAWQYVTVYLSLTIVSWAYKILMENYTRARLGEPKYGRLLIGYTSPTIFLSGICLLLLFATLDICHKGLIRIIRFFSPLTFSVYLIHVHPIPWNHLILDRFRSFNLLPWYQAIFLVPGCAFAIWLTCSLLDIPRYLLFRLLRIRKLCEAIERRLIPF